MKDNDARLTLLELNGLVREVIELGMPNEYWVEAELSEWMLVRPHFERTTGQRSRALNRGIFLFSQIFS